MILGTKFVKTALFFLLVVMFTNHVVNAQTPSQPPTNAFGPQCVGTGIGQYAASVIKNAPNLNHVKFLTPVFNLTDPTNAAVVGAFKTSLTAEGVSLDSFDYLAGNAYNMDGGTISGFVNNFYAAAGSTKTLILTEMGWFTPDSTYRATQADYDKAKSELELVGNSLHAALYFAPYPNISNPEFSKHNYLGSNFGEDLCPSGNCGKIGANPGLVNPTDPALYGRINDDGLGYVLGIAGGTSVEAHLGENGFITKAHNAGITPILRFGTATGGGSGFEPSLQGGKIYADKMIAFVKELDSKVSKDVYVILGPNEPMTECWATPNCGGCGAFNNDVTGDEYACNVPADDPVKKTIIVKGQITQSTWTDTPNPGEPQKMISRTGLGIGNGVVTNYSGDPCTVSKLGAKSHGGNLVNIDYKRSPHVSSSSDGHYELPIHMTSHIKERFIAFSCNGQIADLYKIDMTKDTDGVIKLDVDLNCQGTYTTVNSAGQSVRPYVKLIPKSPGENIPLSNMNSFTMCMEAYTSRPQIREPMEISVKDNTGSDEDGPVIQYVRATDKDLSYLPPTVSPDPNCDPANVTPGYDICMPDDLNPINEEFSSFTTVTHAGKDQLNAYTNEALLDCGPINQMTTLRYDQNPDKPAPASKGKYPYLLPSCAYIESMNSYKSTNKTDPLGKLKVNKNQQGIVQKFATTPVTLKNQIKFMDPDMRLCYNGEGDIVLLGEIEAPGYGGKTLYQLQGRAGTGKTYPSSIFPSSCLRELPNSLSITSPLKFYSGNDDDSAVTDTGESACADPYNCMRDLPIGQKVSVGGVDADTTGRRSYAEMTNIETPGNGLQKLSGALSWGGPDSANAGKGGLANILTYPKDKRTEFYETGAGLSPKAPYVREGDNEATKIGFPIVNYCMCAQSEHANGICANPLNEVDIPNQGDDALMLSRLNNELVSGSVWLNNGSEAKKFYGAEHAPWGGISKFIDFFKSLGSAIFAGRESVAGGNNACITYDWSEWSPGYCRQPPDYTSLCKDGTVKCIPSGTSTEQDCPYENDCKYTAPGATEPVGCTTEQAASCKTSQALPGVTCIHRVQDGPPAEWGYNEHPDCKGDIQVTREQHQEYSGQVNNASTMFADAWLYPKEEKNACAQGGTVETVQANYDFVEKTTTNYTSPLELGQNAGCVQQQKVYKLSDRPYKGLVVKGDAVIGSRANPNPTCNAFNVDADRDGVVDEIDFEESLEIAANTIAGDRNKQTSQLIDEYGPYCIVEFSGSPYAWNVTDFIDRTAVAGLNRKCKNKIPPKTLRPQDVGKPQSCNGYGRSPGDADFDYYRGALNRNSCPLKTHSWPDSVSMGAVLRSLQNAYYNGNYMNAGNPPALKELREEQLPMVLAKAKEKNINPYILVAFWGTESGWSNRPSCYNNPNP